MGRRKKAKQGFNTPFEDLRLEVPTETAQESQTAPLSPSPAPEQDAATDAELFAAAVRDTQPLSHRRGRVEPAKRESATLVDDEQLALLELQDLVDGKGRFTISESEEELSGHAPGVSAEVLERLRSGSFSWRKHIDLHGLSRDEAKAAVTRFVAETRRNGERCVLVITGRGRSSPGGVSVLRETLPRWLSRAPSRAHVLAFCTARAVDGGPGAFYVLLRRLGKRPYGGGQ